MTEATRLRRLPATVPVTEGDTKPYRVIFILGLLHIPLGVFIYSQPTLGLFHQVAVFVFAFYCAGQKQIKLERVAMVVAYIVGAEVLWRMAGVSVFWEMGKYGSSLIFILALVRRQIRRFPIVPLLYFVALTPAAAITLSNQPDTELARNMLSSGMSGPLFLAVSCVFGANLEVTKVGIQRIIAAMILPLVSIGFVTLFFTVSADQIQFTGESNFATSGGYGPNQVSAMLGAGVFGALLLLIIFHNSFREKLVLGVVALFMAAQSVMTFSRGGMYAAVGATTATALILLVREPGTAIKRLAPILIASLIFLGLIFPFMDNWTDGSLSERFEDTQGTNRTEIVEADLNIFLENPVFGAGVGSAYSLRQQYLDRKAMSHTEFTRLVSEHGLFGVFALVTLAIIAITNITRQKTLLGRAFVVGTVVWACLFMVNAGMRLAAPSLMWGLTFLTIANERVRLRRAIRKPLPKKFKVPQRA